MSLKEFTKEVFTRYGLTEEEINVYLAYLRVPRSTITQAWMFCGEENYEVEKITEITKKLEDNGFVKKISGIIDRYIPLEPFFELFTHESEEFRNEIGIIKDNVLADQSDRFENLEQIQDKSINEVETAVETQLNAFVADSDTKDQAKKERIDNAKNRFTTTSKEVEKEVHNKIEADYSRLTGDVNKADQDADNIWDSNSQKFTNDNGALNKEVSGFTESENKKLEDLVSSENSKLEILSSKQIEDSKNQESKIHQIMDSLNSDLKSISESFVSDNESGINTATDNLNGLIADLLKDFASRIEGLEKELKKELDDHVERHKNVANELKPRMEQILEKYLERMNKVVTDLKSRITKILQQHADHVKSTTTNLKDQLVSTVDSRHNQMSKIATDFKDHVAQLIDNLLTNANNFTDFSEDMANKGFFWIGKKKKYKEKNEQVIQDVLTYTEPLKEKFANESSELIDGTNQTSEKLKSEISEIMNNENNTLKEQTDDLDRKAQETISAELETLATDMASEIDSTLQGGIKDCADTTVKLKDSVEKSFSTHHDQYQSNINRHKEDVLRHYSDLDGDIKRKNQDWVREVDGKFQGGKREISTEIETQTTAIEEYKTNQTQNINEFKNNQIQNLKDYNSKVVNKNNEHSKTFGNDVNQLKEQQRALFDELLNKVRTDFDESKKFVSEKIDNEIKLWDGESADMDKNLSVMLADHKTKYDENAHSLQDKLSTTIRDNTQNVKDAIADFTLEFMNAIDDSTEKAENNEDKLKDISTAAAAIPEFSEVKTWHTIGKDALIAAIKDAVYRVKSSIIIVTPIVVPEILQLIAEYAFQKKAARFMLTSHWDMDAYGTIIKKMMQLDNIQFRNLTSQGEYFACTRDAEEVILAPYTEDESQLISMVSTQDGYTKLYSSVIGPMFLSNSRPIK